jgi:hypothetical protein
VKHADLGRVGFLFLVHLVAQGSAWRHVIGEEAGRPDGRDQLPGKGQGFPAMRPLQYSRHIRGREPVFLRRIVDPVEHYRRLDFVFQEGHDEHGLGIVIGGDDAIGLQGLIQRMRFLGLLRSALASHLGIHVEVGDLAAGRQNRVDSFADLLDPGVVRLVAHDHQHLEFGRYRGRRAGAAYGRQQRH